MASLMKFLSAFLVSALSSVLCFGLVSCAVFATRMPGEVFVPTAKRIIIYSNGGSVISGSFDSTILGDRRLRLPSSAEEIKFYHNNQIVKWFTIQEIQEAKKDPAGTEKYLLVGLPPLKSGDIKFYYSLPEITWYPQIEAEIIDNSTILLPLQAYINMGSNQTYQNCAVTLVLNSAVSVEKISGYTFNLNSFDLLPRRNIVYSLDKKTAGYSLLREWNTYEGKDQVRVLIQVRNPFSIDLENAYYSVESNQVSIEKASSLMRSGEYLLLGAGIDDTIATFRSVKITETQDKRLLPFNHSISYEITNKSGQEKILRLVSSRVMGNEHRSVYHFTRPPDSTPENTLIWMIRLKPGGTEKLEYDYDADVKDVQGENGFEAGG